MDIFISYAVEDRDAAEHVCRALEKRNITYFQAPKGIAPGEPWADRIRSAFLEAKEVWVIASPHSLGSEWVTTEWGAAWMLMKPIVPILHQCAVGDLPDRLRDSQVGEIYKIDEIVDCYAQAHCGPAPAPVPPGGPAPMAPDRAERSRVLLLDIDGTVLPPHENLRAPAGITFVRLLQTLTSRQYACAFITGNDIDLQRGRVLDPLRAQGLGPSVFCFTDGGSRAFEYAAHAQDYQELTDYSDKNVMDPELVTRITGLFERTLQSLTEAEREMLRLPDVRLYQRTLDYLDVIIFPMRPSFLESDAFEEFCRQIEALFHDPDVQQAVFQLMPFRGGLLIRAYAKNPESDVFHLQTMINRRVLRTSEYRDVSLPEPEVRGGKKVCQIALKPFNDPQVREAFRGKMAKALGDEALEGVAIRLGGRTTIDVQLEGVDKAKAVRFLSSHRGLEPLDMIYFGDEFRPHGNDRPVLEMDDSERPKTIVNVGPRLDPSDPLAGRLLEDNHGPEGTLSYLRFLAHVASQLG
jgi:hydroxymethylpyrimidine pyrophosphatase-like HAD family hydrolase